MMEDKNPLSAQLRNLGTMRKKRGSDAFKNKLRAKLSERAEELEAKPVQRFSFDWKHALSQRFMPAASLALVAVIMLQVLVGPGGLNLPIELINVAEAQDYYTLTPSNEEADGIEADAYFTLSSKGAIDADEMLEVLSISPEITFDLEQVDSQTIEIIPNEELEAGSLYQFELAAQNLEDAPYKKTFRWAYTVSDSFRVTGTHPGYQSTGAPINTGIEINVTHLGVDINDVETNFSISPEVNGAFSLEDKTITFVPSTNLLENTIYTVTLNKDLPLANTDQTLTEDYVWAFETDDEASTDVSLRIDRFVTIAPDESSLIQSYAYDRNADRDEVPVVDVNIFQYNNSDDFLAAIQEYRESVPAWTGAAEEQYKSSSNDLALVGSSESLPLYEKDHRDYIQLPQALDEGLYLMNVQFGNEWEQSFVQVSNTATYLAISPAESLIWVNDIVTGQPVEGATVTVLGNQQTTKTDKDGLATFDKLYEELGFELGEDSHLQISVETERDTTFYDKSFYYYDNDNHDKAWGLFETDRNTYRPNDTLEFWGMVQGRDDTFSGDAKLYITKNTYWYVNEPSSLDDFDDLVDVIDVEVKDGQLFQGKVELSQYDNAYHSVYLVLDNEIVLSDSFYVENFELPAYEIVISSDREAYWAGEEVTIDIEARFFDGTPVAHTDLLVNDPNGASNTVTTDAYGLASASWTAEARDADCYDGSCSIYYSDNFKVAPAQEELADISDWFSFSVYRSEIVLQSSIEKSHKHVEFKTYELDLHEDYSNRITETIATSGSVDYTITRQDTITTTEDYYDDVDKVTKQKTSSKTVYTELLSGSLTQDQNGLYQMDFDLDEDKNHRINLTVNDGNGGYYNPSIWISSVYNGDLNPYMTLSTTDDNNNQYSIGDSISLEATLDSSPIKSDDDHFLFIQARKGIQETTVQEEETYTFEYKSDDVPNVYVTAVRFDGTAYQTTSNENIRLDLEDREFDVSAEVDKEKYAPGDTITVSIQTEQASDVQIQLVDEAYYSLYDEDLFNPLTDIYASLSANIDAVEVSHALENFDEGKGGCFVPGTQILMADGSTKNIEEIQVGDKILTRENEFSDQLIVAEVSALHSEAVRNTLLVNGDLGLTDNHIIFLNGKWTEAVKLKLGDLLLDQNGEWITVETLEEIVEDMRVYNFEVKELHTYFADGFYVHNDKGGSARSDFPVTAYFDVIKTDSNGKAETTFTLPDSITEWRVSVAAVATGKEIYAGSTSAEVIVTKDAFIVPVLNTTYLEGDQPMLPVRAYGDKLSLGDTTDFWLESESIGLGLNATGTAFETSYFELDPLTEGIHDFTFGLESSAGDDSVYLETEVVDSYFRLPQSEETLLGNGVSIPGSETSRTEVTFLNLENSAIYRTLSWALRQDGNRADEALGRSIAALWLNENFDLEMGVIDFTPGVYQDVRIDSGISLFPYSDPDLELSAQMAALTPELWNEASLREYFESVLYDPEMTLTEKMQSLYGLAGIGQNVLLELTVFEKELELSNEDKLWAALAYSEIGAGNQVSRLFLELVEENWNADQLMLVATLADYVSSDQRETLYEAARESDDFILLSSLIYTKQRLTHISGDPVSFTLNGEKIELDAGSSETRSFTTEELDSIDIQKVDGAILAISDFWDSANPEDSVNTDQIGIERWYEMDGEIVEVHFKLDVEAETGYRVLDYLPSGLQPISKSYSSWWIGWTNAYRSPYQTNNQELSFHVYCEKTCSSLEFYYLARVVNPGTFKAEPALLQQFSELDITTISKEETMVIQP